MADAGDKPYRLGTRRSALAMTQANWVAEKLRAAGVACEIVPLVSEGDRDRETPLYEIETESPGLFTKHLQRELLAGSIDLAVHSLKDLPTLEPSGLRVASIPERELASDVLVIHPKAHAPGNPGYLVTGARVGTSSLRREAQLLSLRADLRVLPIRGNVPTRVDLVRRGEMQAVVLAEAGLRRLGLDLAGLVSLPLPGDAFVPAPGQGALAVETREELQPPLEKALRSLRDERTVLETRVERAILRALEGGCTLPLGVRCEAGPGHLRVRAFLGLYREPSPGNREWYRFERFDISGTDEHSLVAKTIAHFREVQADA